MEHPNNSNGFVGAWQNMKKENKVLKEKILEYEHIIHNLDTPSTSIPHHHHENTLMVDIINKIADIHPSTVEKETEEYRVIREEEEKIAEQMARIAKIKAELKAKKYILPLREAETRLIEREKKIAETYIDVLKRQMDEATKNYNEAFEIFNTFDERIGAVNRGDRDAELLAKVKNRTAEVETKELSNVSIKNEVAKSPMQ